MSKRYHTRSQSSKTNSAASSVVIAPPEEFVIQIEPCREVCVPIPVPPKPLSRSVRFISSQTTDSSSQTDIPSKTTDVSQELYKECLTIETFVHCAKVEEDRCKRIAITLQMYHYLENHHLYMKASPKFKDTIRTKIQEYDMIAEMEKEALHIMDESFLENRKKYLKQHEIVVLCNQLKEACVRLQTILDSF